MLKPNIILGVLIIKSVLNALIALPTHGTTRVTTHTCYSIAATTPELTIEILNSVF